jgi:hypothetical protein
MWQDLTRLNCQAATASEESPESTSSLRTEILGAYLFQHSQNHSL